jgi:threonine dehydratase
VTECTVLAEPTLADIRAARQALAGKAHVTPIMSSRSLAELSGSRSVVVKPENLQRSGSFKIRGATTRLSLLTLVERDRGVMTFSSGNHGQALALAGREIGVRVIVCMPQDAARSKLQAVEGYGAEVVLYDRHQVDREVFARELAAERSMTLVPPFDDYGIIRGQGTAMLEIHDQTAGDVDTIVVPIGGGGLISGIAIAAKALDSRIRMVGVEAEDANDTYLSRQAGHRVSIRPPSTIADGMRNPTPGALTFPIVQRLVDDIVLVSDAEIRRAVVFALTRMKLVVEPTGATTLAWLISGRADVAGRRVCCLLSGGNIDMPVLARLLREAGVEVPD